MTRQEYINNLLAIYQLVSVLSQKEDAQVLHLRHRMLKKDLILRSYAAPQNAYATMLPFQCDQLPLVYQVEALEDGQIVLEEYIRGMTVSQVMEVSHFRPSSAKKVLKQLCMALAILHQNSIVHRDVKPENVMVSDGGRVVLIDLSISRKVIPGGSDTQILGTVGYAAPEQLGLGQSDGRTDIYAMGVLYNVMLTGKHPSVKLARGKAGRIIRKCTAVNPDDRYQTPQKLLQALDGI